MVENIPGVHVSVLSGEEQDGGSGGTPGGRRETLGVGTGSTLQLSLYSSTDTPHSSPRPHDGAALDVLGPDLGGPVPHSQEMLQGCFN